MGRSPNDGVGEFARSWWIRGVVGAGVWGVLGSGGVAGGVVGVPIVPLFRFFPRESLVERDRRFLAAVAAVVD